MPTFDPQAAFPDFYSNPAIQALAPASRWTISGNVSHEEPKVGPDGVLVKPSRKAPLDIRAYLDLGWIRGARRLDAQCLITLDELTTEIPMASNAAFRIQAPTDGLLVIDIEADCPPETSAALLALPDILYAEESMSGKGFHLLAELPDNFGDFPIAARSVKLQHETKHYEILLNHWITFTRRPIPAHHRTRATPQATGPFSSVEALYASLAANAREPGVSASGVITTEAPREIRGADRIIANTIAASRHRLKTLDEFHGDNSRFEFSILGVLYRQLIRHLVDYVDFEDRFTPGDQAWLLYQAATEVIPPRHKHLEQRGGRPYLLERAAAMVAQHTTDRD